MSSPVSTFSSLRREMEPLNRTLIRCETIHYFRLNFRPNNDVCQCRLNSVPPNPLNYRNMNLKTDITSEFCPTLYTFGEIHVPQEFAIRNSTRVYAPCVQSVGAKLQPSEILTLPLFNPPKAIRFRRKWERETRSPVVSDTISRI